MKKPPKDPGEIYSELTADILAVLGTDALSVCVFGSAVTGDYRPGISDINLLIVTQPTATMVASRLMSVVERWRPARVGVPVVFAEGQLAASADVFPIEIMTMAAAHQVLHGSDPFEGIEISMPNLRLQLERELRAKRLAIASRLMASGGRMVPLKALVAQATVAMVALMQAWLKLATGSFPLRRREVMEEVAATGLEVGAFRALERVKAGELRPSEKELVNLLEKAITELEMMIRRVDSLSVKDS